MPEMDGLAFLKAIRAGKTNIPYLLLTGCGSEAVASDAITAGVTDCIPKGGRLGVGYFGIGSRCPGPTAVGVTIP